MLGYHTFSFHVLVFVLVFVLVMFLNSFSKTLPLGLTVLDINLSSCVEASCVPSDTVLIPTLKASYVPSSIV